MSPPPVRGMWRRAGLLVWCIAVAAAFIFGGMPTAQAAGDDHAAPSTPARGAIAAASALGVATSTTGSATTYNAGSLSLSTARVNADDTPTTVGASERVSDRTAEASRSSMVFVAANTGDALLSTASSGAGKALPMNMQTVCEVGCKYNVDISDVTININKARAGYAGSTASDGTITLTRSAFANEEQLARTLAHERFHVDQIRSGMGYPTSYDASNAWEQAARAYEDDWWAGQ